MGRADYRGPHATLEHGSATAAHVANEPASGFGFRV